MKGWMKFLVFAMLAGGGAIYWMRACAAERERREQESLREEMRESAWRHKRDRFVGDIRILKIQIATQEIILEQLEKRNRGRNDPTWWKRFEERETRLATIRRDTEGVGPVLYYYLDDEERVKTAEEEIKRIEAAIKQYQEDYR